MRGVLSTIATALAVLALAGCGQGESPGGSPPTYQSTTASPSATADIPAFTLGSEMTPGAYTSQVFATPITFTVPAGWKVFEDEPGQFGLARVANDGPPLLVLRDIDAGAADCSMSAVSGVSRDPESLATWISTQDGLVASEPEPVNVSGLDGYSVDVTMDDTWSQVCPSGDTAPSVPLIVGSGLSNGVQWGVAGGENSRYIVLSLPGAPDANIVLVADACCGVDPAEQLSAQMSVIDTITFDTSGG